VSRLVIEYVLEGHQRGYNFTSSTQGFDDTVLKSVWRNAMPRGQGWADYTGSRSIKGFPLDNGTVAVSEMTVTDLKDENGRRGIRRAEVDVMSPMVYSHHLQSRRDGYPRSVREQADWFYMQVRQSFPRLKNDMPLILAHPFNDNRSWWAVEATVLALAAYPLPQMHGWGPVITFTTLALDYRNDSRVLALPLDRTHDITNIPVVRLRE
jgi:hypothetical protein